MEIKKGRRKRSKKPTVGQLIYDYPFLCKGKVYCRVFDGRHGPYNTKVWTAPKSPKTLDKLQVQLAETLRDIEDLGYLLCTNLEGTELTFLYESYEVKERYEDAEINLRGAG